MGSKRPKKRIKRHHLKRFSSVVVNSGAGIIPNRGVISEYHSRVSSTIGPKHNLSPLKNNSFMQSVPVTRMVSQGIAANKIKQAEWRSEAGRGWGQEEFHCIVLLTTAFKTIKKYFARKLIFFVEEDYRLMIKRTSLTYGNEVNAMLAYKSGKIAWDKSEKILPPS